MPMTNARSCLYCRNVANSQMSMSACQSVRAFAGTGKALRSFFLVFGSRSGAALFVSLILLAGARFGLFFFGFEVQFCICWGGGGWRFRPCTGAARSSI